MYIVFDEAKLYSLLLTTAFHYDRSPSYNVTMNEVFFTSASCTGGHIFDNM